MFSPYSRFWSTVSNMKFTRVRIDGFYNLRDVDLDLTNRNALIVGPNGSGKTNIIKCICFLVNWILGHRDTNMRICDVNDPKCKIEVKATLSKAEVELFSNLRVCYLVRDVCVVVLLAERVMMNFVIYNSGMMYGKDLSLDEYSNTVSRIHKKEFFSEIPEETFNEIFRIGSFAELDRDLVHPSSLVSVRLDNPRMSSIVKKTLNKLLPKLLEIMKRALASEKDNPKFGSDVDMWVKSGRAGGGLDHSSNM